MAYLNLRDIEKQELVPGFHVRFVHSPNMTLAYWDIDEGANLPDHTHPHEQVVNLIEGEFILTVGGEDNRMIPGAVYVIPGNVPHAGRAITPCRIIDVFHPVREDYQ